MMCIVFDIPCIRWVDYHHNISFNCHWIAIRLNRVMFVHRSQFFDNCCRVSKCKVRILDLFFFLRKLFYCQPQFQWGYERPIGLPSPSPFKRRLPAAANASVIWADTNDCNQAGPNFSESLGMTTNAVNLFWIASSSLKACFNWPWISPLILPQTAVPVWVDLRNLRRIPAFRNPMCCKSGRDFTISSKIRSIVSCGKSFLLQQGQFCRCRWRIHELLLTFCIIRIHLLKLPHERRYELVSSSHLSSTRSFHCRASLVLLEAHHLLLRSKVLANFIEFVW